ncbi:MAG TPA: ribosomal protein L7/L12 [Kofleriaceae bacterium]|nr:ribosomal protein L7/L12 [Kofleriaceae bacterium]
MSDALEATLIASIRERPDDDEIRLVYADLLEQRGDPRGEYLRLELELARIPTRLDELARQIDPAWLAQVQRRYTLYLTRVGSSLIGTIKEVREVTGIGLKEAKDLVDAVRAGQRREIISGKTQAEAHTIARRFAGLAELQVIPQLRRASTLEVWLVEIDEGCHADAAEQVARTTGRTLADARALVLEVTGGTPARLRGELDFETAETIASAFVGIARLEFRGSPIP